MFRDFRYNFDDPRIHTSYIYEFNAKQAGWAPTMNMKEWKLKQIETFGPAVPIVRCMLHDPKINLAYSGDIYETALFWEQDPATALLRKRLASGVGAKGSKSNRLCVVRVVDAASQPVPASEIQYVLQNDLGLQPLETVLTDGQGEARIGLWGERFEQLKLRVKSRNHVPKEKVIAAATAGFWPVAETIQLDQAESVGGRMVDEGEKPVSGARVRLKNLTLGTGETVYYEADKSPTSLSNNEGRWLIDGLPADFTSVGLEIFHTEYRTAFFETAQTVDPGTPLLMLKDLKAGKASLTLVRRFFIKGKIADATTGERIQRFTIMLGYDTNRTVRWDWDQVFRGSGSQFEMGFDIDPPSFIRIEAEGYLPAISRHISADEVSATINMSLAKAENIVGRVQTSQGDPVVGAEVALGTDTRGVVLSQAKFKKVPGGILAVTDKEGRFSLPPDPEAHTLYVAHERGFADVPLKSMASNPRVVLQSWGQIRGQLPRGNGSRFSDSIVLLTADFSLPGIGSAPAQGTLAFDFDSFAVHPDNQGSFTITRVPPGDWYLWHPVVIDPRQPMEMGNLSFNGSKVKVEIGQVAQIRWNDLNSVLRGAFRETTPVGDQSADWASADWSSRLAVIRFTPRENGQMDARERYVTLNGSGQFAIAALPSGNYLVESEVIQPPLRIPTALKAELRVTAGRGAIQDLNVTNVQSLRRTATGKPMPAMEVQTLEGKPLKLSEFQGKWVLLDFWTASSDPRLADWVYLQTLYDQFGKTGDLVIVSLNLDQQIETARSFLARQPNPWLQAHAGYWLKGQFPSVFNCACSLPMAVLLDPKGTIMDYDLCGLDMVDAVGFHLAAQKNAAQTGPRFHPIEVMANLTWQASKIRVEKGQRFSVRAIGQWTHGLQGNTYPYYGMEGFDKYAGDMELPSARVGALLGRIQQGKPFLIPRGRPLVAAETGELEFTMNDNAGRDNNNGSLKVQVRLLE